MVGNVFKENISPMIVLIPSKPRDTKRVVMKTLVRKVVFCSWLIVPAGVKSIFEILCMKKRIYFINHLFFYLE